MVEKENSHRIYKSLSVNERKYHLVEEEIERNKKQHCTPREVEEFLVRLDEFYRLHPCEIDVYRLANIIVRRLKSDRDFFVVFEGMRGSGKSNLMLLVMIVMCRYAGYYRNRLNGDIVKVLPRLNPPDKNIWERLTCSFSFDANLSFLDQVKDLQSKFNSIDRYSPFGIDEGSKNLHKHNWQSKLQFKLIQMSDTERVQNKSFFICIPNFRELNSTFRNDRIQMRLYIYVRYTKEDYASACLSVRDPGRWNSDPWFIEENEKRFEYVLRRKPAALRTPKDIIYAEKGLKGYAGEMHIPNLKTLFPQFWGVYMSYKISNSQRELAEEVEEESPEHKQNSHLKYALKKMMAFIKLKFPKVRYADFAKLTALPMSAISQIWKEDVKVPDEYNTLVAASSDIKDNKDIA